MPHPTLIVQYEADAVTAAVAASGVSVASVQVAAAAAAQAAGDRGASAARRAEIAAVATAAAMTTPAVSALTFGVYREASAQGIEVTGVTNFATVMQGAAIRTASSGAASQLKAQLEGDPKVKAVWYAVRRGPGACGGGCLLGGQCPDTMAAASEQCVSVSGEHGACPVLRPQGVRPLVKPVKASDLAAYAAEEAAAARAAATKPRRFTPTSAADGSSNATGLAALRAMDPALDGSGQLICIIDTGLAFLGNPLYGGCTGLNAPKGRCKVVAGYDFVGSNFTGLQTGPAAVRGGPPVSS
jgi:hypothetical protein